MRAIYFAVMWDLNQSRKQICSSLARVSILNIGHSPAAYCNMFVYSEFGLDRDLTTARITTYIVIASNICLQ